MDNRLTWLHLSDLHACPVRTGWDARRVLRTLTDDLRRMEQDFDLRPDVIFFTGDAAFGHISEKPGERIADQFKEAHDFLEGVRTAFTTPVEQTDLFLVPGNHDADRSQITSDQTEWLDQQKSLDSIIQMIQTNGLQWRRYMERLHAYRQFLRDSGYTHLLTDEERLIYAVRREIRGVKVGIAGLNSAWSCGRSGERGRLWVGGRWQIGHLMKELEDVHVRIALIHHPGSWFVEYEDPNLSLEIEREFHFHLHGHEHQGWVDGRQGWVDGRQGGHTRIAASACYDRSDAENGYSFVRLDLAAGVGEVFLRRYDRYGGGWVPRVVANRTTFDGRWVLTHLEWLAPLRLQSGTAAARVAGAETSSVVEHDRGGLSQAGPGEGRTALRRLELIRTLNSLPSLQFDFLVIELSPPSGILPSQGSTAQGDRAVRLLQWAESPAGPGIGCVETTLASIRETPLSAPKAAELAAAGAAKDSVEPEQFGIPNLVATDDAQPDPRVLREAIVRHFSVDELAELCFEVESDLRRHGIDSVKVDLDTVGGSGLASRVLGLIQYLHRRDLLGYLVTAVRRTRPGAI